MTITTDTTLLHDPRRQAALLYWQGFSVPQIAAMLQMKRPTVQSWKQRDGWDSVAPISRVEMSLEARLTQLIIKPQKTGGDFKEIDLLGRQIERLARVNRYSQTGNEADLNPNVANRNKGGRRKPKKNFFSDEAIEKLEQIFFEQSFEYQLHWYRAGLEHRIRDILKSRQIGATFYFSREALLRALKTGHNQIFLSASKTQAYVFREYIIAFARLVDVDLTGDPIVLGNNGAKLIFLGTNSNTAQSHNGDLYVDEIFWIPNFQVLRKVASGMASQSHLRSTYFSTPSTLAHDAYTPEMKTAMVLKAKDVIRRGCLEYDVSATDITSSFMAIRKTMTSSGRSATYEASRSEEASHADLAWATMHALLNEPLTAGISTPLTSTILEFY
ncbi:TPA: terminase family protein [Escherichia coli]|uniref:terminase large subunit domain-containing protein n=1 Tax=Escherichia coli TaxID=562 RepID=UPI001B9AF795|nr:terminase family protein [Escherichia coli]